MLITFRKGSVTIMLDAAEQRVMSKATEILNGLAEHAPTEDAAAAKGCATILSALVSKFHRQSAAHPPVPPAAPVKPEAPAQPKAGHQKT